jgi:hypothetical protein
MTAFGDTTFLAAGPASERIRYAVEAETTRPASGASFSVVRERLGIR